MPPFQGKALELVWPLGGLDRRRGYQDQAPYTTPGCQNVLPRETIEVRDRGGSRPGLNKSFYEEIPSGSGTLLRMLANCTYVQSNTQERWDDNFEASSLGSIWTTGTWVGTIPSVVAEGVTATTYTPEVAAVRAAFTDFSTTKLYELGLLIVPWEDEHRGIYYLYVRMDDTTPDVTTDGVEIALVMTGSTGEFTGSFTDFLSGTATTSPMTPGTLSAAKPGWFRVTVSGTLVTAYWQEKTLGSITASAHSGKRIGFGMKNLTGGQNLVKRFRFQGVKTADVEVPRNLIATSGGNQLWRETRLGLLARVATAGTDPNLASDRYIMAEERTQKLYIADTSEPRISVTDGVTSGSVITTASVSDLTAEGISVYSDVVVVTGDNTFKISAVATGSITVSGTLVSGTGKSVRVERGPKVFTPSDDALAIWFATAGKGQVPTGCRLVALYRDRMVLAGQAANPHVWYMSRSGDPLDWDYSADATDALRAIAGSSTDEAGRIGEPITALIPHTDESLLMGTLNQLYVLTHDPAAGGRFDLVSRDIGIIGPEGKAWCRTSEGVVVFLSRDGLYMVSPGGNAYPQSVSREKLPKDLRDIDPEMATVLMEYDIRHRLVYIFVSYKDSRPTTHYAYDWQTPRGFWPIVLGTRNHDPFSILQYRSYDAQDACVLLGCRDGYVRRFLEQAESDDGTAITSFVDYGPLLPGGHISTEGMVTELALTLARGSGGVIWGVRASDHHEGAVNAATNRASGTFTTSGLSYKRHPRVRGASAVIRMTNQSTNRRWAVEKLVVELTPLTERRKL